MGGKQSQSHRQFEHTKKRIHNSPPSPKQKAKDSKSKWDVHIQRRQSWAEQVITRNLKF